MASATAAALTAAGNFAAGATGTAAGTAAAGTTAAGLGAVTTTASSLLGTGLGVAQATGALGGPDVPDAPDPRRSQRGTDPATVEASRRERRRQAAATGRSDTILTGGQGAQQSGGQVGRKSLLGE